MNSHEDNWPHICIRSADARRGIVVGLAMVLTICFTAAPAFADLITTTSALPTSSLLDQYAIVSAGSTASIMMNSGSRQRQGFGRRWGYGHVGRWW